MKRLHLPGSSVRVSDTSSIFSSVFLAPSIFLAHPKFIPKSSSEVVSRLCLVVFCAGVWQIGQYESQTWSTDEFKKQTLNRCVRFLTKKKKKKGNTIRTMPKIFRFNIKWIFKFIFIKKSYSWNRLNCNVNIYFINNLWSIIKNFVFLWQRCVDVCCMTLHVLLVAVLSSWLWVFGKPFKHWTVIVSLRLKN